MYTRGNQWPGMYEYNAGLSSIFRRKKQRSVPFRMEINPVLSIFMKSKMITLRSLVKSWSKDIWPLILTLNTSTTAERRYLQFFSLHTYISWDTQQHIKVIFYSISIQSFKNNPHLHNTFGLSESKTCVDLQEVFFSLCYHIANG